MLNWSGSRGIAGVRRGRWSMVGVKVSGKSLSRLETLQSTPPFFQLNFLLCLKMGEYWLWRLKIA